MAPAATGAAAGFFSALTAGAVAGAAGAAGVTAGAGDAGAGATGALDGAAGAGACAKAFTLSAIPKTRLENPKKDDFISKTLRR